MTKVIDDEKEHHKVLYELGLLDDDDNWPLYQLQEREFSALDPDDLETWFKYVKKRR